MNYKETNEQGQVWTRCYRVEVSNPYNGIQSVNMMEETIISIAGETITKPGRLLTKEFSAGETVELVNPNNGEPLGISITHQDLYVMMYSLWLKTAKERDAVDASFTLPTVAPNEVPVGNIGTIDEQAIPPVVDEQPPAEGQ